MGRDSKQKHGTSQSKNKPAEVNNVHGRFESLFGFKTSDLTSWDSFLKLMCRPTDPSSLGWLRAMFGMYFNLPLNLMIYISDGNTCIRKIRCGYIFHT